MKILSKSMCLSIRICVSKSLPGFKKLSSDKYI